MVETHSAKVPLKTVANRQQEDKMKRLALPAIWNFEDSDHGYYSFRELLHAVNDRLDKIGRRPWTAKQLLRRFFIVTRKGYTEWNNGDVVSWVLCMLTDSGLTIIFSAEEMSCYGPHETMYPHITIAGLASGTPALEDLYAPTGWGKKVLDYLDQGVEGVIPTGAPSGMKTFVVGERPVMMR